MSDLAKAISGTTWARDCGCALCKDFFDRSKAEAPTPLRPVATKGALDWNKIPGRIQVVEIEDSHALGMLLTFAATAALGIAFFALAAMGGLLLAQTLRHAGMSGAAVLHQLHTRLS